MKEYAVQVLKMGLPGAMAGSVAGFAMAACAGLVNKFFIGPTETLTYNYKGRDLEYRNLASVADLKVEDDLKVLQQYRFHNPAAYDAGARLVQHIIDANDHFFSERAKKRDGLKDLSRLQQAAKRANTCFRALYYTVKDSGNHAGAEEVDEVMGNLVVTFERLIGWARNEFTLKPQL